MDGLQETGDREGGWYMSKGKLDALLKCEGVVIHRVHCCVPHCKRSYKNDDAHVETLCGKHWRLASPILRKRAARLFRAYRKRFGNNHFSAYPAGSARRLEAVRLHNLCFQMWERCKKQAIERAMGI